MAMNLQSYVTYSCHWVNVHWHETATDRQLLKRNSVKNLMKIRKEFSLWWGGNNEKEGRTEVVSKYGAPL